MAQFVQLLQKDPKKMISNLIIKNMRGIMKEIYLLQHFVPFLFSESFETYIQLGNFLIENVDIHKDENILKCSLFILIKVLKTFVYYVEPGFYEKTLNADQKKVEKTQLQSILFERFNKFFNKNMIELLLLNIFQKALMKEFEKFKNNPEEMIDNGKQELFLIYINQFFKKR